MSKTKDLEAFKAINGLVGRNCFAQLAQDPKKKLEISKYRECARIIRVNSGLILNERA